MKTANILENEQLCVGFLARGQVNALLGDCYRKTSPKFLRSMFRISRNSIHIRYKELSN